MVLTWVTRPAAGARSEVCEAGLAPPLGAARLRRRRGQPRQLLVVGDHLAFADQHIGDLGSLLIDPDHRFAARHDKSGDPHQVGEAGIGGFRDDDQRVARRFLLLGVGAMLKPVPAAAQDRETGHR